MNTEQEGSRPPCSSRRRLRLTPRTDAKEQQGSQGLRWMPSNRYQEATSPNPARAVTPSVEITTEQLEHWLAGSSPELKQQPGEVRRCPDYDLQTYSAGVDLPANPAAGLGRTASATRSQSRFEHSLVPPTNKDVATWSGVPVWRPAAFTCRGGRPPLPGSRIALENLDRPRRS